MSRRLENYLARRLSKAGVEKTRGIIYEDPFYSVDTSHAPQDTREFPRYVRRTIDVIMDDVKLEVVANSQFHVRVKGEQSEKYVLTAQRLGRKAVSQRKRKYDGSEKNRAGLFELTYNQSGTQLFRDIINMMVGIRLGGFLAESPIIKGEYVGAFCGSFYECTVKIAGKRLINQARTAVGLEKKELDEESIMALANTLVGAAIGYYLYPENPRIGAGSGALLGNIYHILQRSVETTTTGACELTKNLCQYIIKQASLNRRTSLAKRADDYSRFGRTISQGFVMVR